jgi:hypothetical protein
VVADFFAKNVSIWQTLSISGDPTKGTFTLELDGAPTVPIRFDAPASDVKAALSALPTLGSGTVICSGGPLPGTAVTIIFNVFNVGPGSSVQLQVGANNLADGTNPAPALSAPSSRSDLAQDAGPRFGLDGQMRAWYRNYATDDFDWNGSPGTRLAGLSWTLAPGGSGGVVPPVRDTQVLSLTGNPTGGTFALAYDDVETVALPSNATADAVQSALRRCRARTSRSRARGARSRARRSSSGSTPRWDPQASWSSSSQPSSPEGRIRRRS